MRTIKYRGLAVNMLEPTWLYGSLVVCDDGTCIIANYMEREFGMEREVRPETVGEFSGLTDKKGNEIYEGDVIQGGRNNRLLIKYNENEASYFAYRLPISEFPSKRRVYQNWINKYNKVVIGNIHDNPELLKRITIKK